MGYCLRGMGDVTTVPIQGSAAPPATLSQFGLPACGWGQKVVGNGPFTCAFDPQVAIGEAWQVPGMYVSMFAPAGLSANTYSAIGWGIILAVGYFMFGPGGSRRRGR